MTTTVCRTRRSTTRDDDGLRAAGPGEEEDAGPGEAGTLFGAAELTGVDVFAAIRDEPGNVSVKTIGQEAFQARRDPRGGAP